MAKINIPFLGITRSTDLLNARPGECTELIDARLRDGSIIPAANRRLETSIDIDIQKMLWHPAARKWLCLSADGGIRILDEDYAAYDTPLQNSLNSIDATDIGVIGNSVTLAARSGMQYMIWKNGQYKWLGVLPSLEDANIEISVRKSQYNLRIPEKDIFKLDVSTFKYIVGPLSGPTIIDEKYNTEPYYMTEESTTNIGYSKALMKFDEKAAGYIAKCYNGIHNDKGYVDAAAFRIAFRLFDNSFIVASPLITIYCPREFSSSVGYSIDRESPIYGTIGRGSNNFFIGYTSGIRLKIFSLGFIPTFTFSGIDLSDWKDIITDISLFTSGSIPFFELSKHPRADGTDIQYEYWRPAISLPAPIGENFRFVGKGNGDADPVYDASENIIEFNDRDPSIKSWSTNPENPNRTFFSDGLMYTEKYRKKFDEIPAFHLCARFGLDGKLMWQTETTAADELALQESLTSDAAVTLRADGNIHVYNQRIHLFGAKEKMPEIISFRNSLSAAAEFDGTPGPSQAKADICVSMQMQGNDIAKVYKQVYFTYEDFIDGILSYPDSRAYKMAIHVTFRRDAGGGTHETVDYVRQFDLRPHDLHNYAYCKIRPEEMLPWPAESVPRIFNDRIEPVDTQPWERYADRPGYWDDVFTDCEDYRPLPAVIQVSNPANPFFFGGKNEISVGQEPVVALMANVVTLSQGQFGEQPLYVFTRDGIYALSVDTSGKIAYTRATPVSLDIAPNARTIAAAGRGVVYTTARALRYIEGDQTISLSESIRGIPGQEIPNSKTLAQLAEATGLADIAADDTPFEEYLPEAIAVHNTQEDEIILSNPHFPFSYVYTVASQSWHKISGSWFAAAARTAWCLLLRKDSASDGSPRTQLWRFDGGTTPSAPFLLITRPQPLGTTAYKHAIQLALRAWMNPDGKRAGIYLLGSNDALHFSLASAAEITRPSRDITLPKFLTRAYRWIIIAIGGTARKDTRITAAEIDAAETFPKTL